MRRTSPASTSRATRIASAAGSSASTHARDGVRWWRGARTTMKAIDAVLADARPKLSPRCGYCLVSSLLVRQEQGTGRVRFRANDRLHQVARSTVPSVARVATRTHACLLYTSDA